MRFHWQNLNEKPYDRVGNGFWKGRCWLWFSARKTISLEWIFGIYQNFFLFDLGCNDEGWYLGVALYKLFALFWHFDIGLPRPQRLSKYYPDTLFTDEREFRFSIHDWTIWLALWQRNGEWNEGDPWWIRGVNFSIKDFFLGKIRYWKETLETREVVIPMPEGSYPATVTMEYSYWKRPRWPRLRVMTANVKIPQGIPHEGKGENSWDCGEDATLDMSCPAKSVEEAIACVVESSLKTRRKYGTPKRIQPKFAEES